jgi:phage repressor protein C with HTH and peptisase S24 domain
LKKYELGVEILNEGKDWTMTAHGNSMMPRIKSGSDLTFRKTNDYRVGDVVLSKVNSKWIGAHKITKIDSEGRYMISNNKGHNNGWTKNVFGRVIAVNGKPFGRRVSKT